MILIQFYGHTSIIVSQCWFTGNPKTEVWYFLFILHVSKLCWTVYDFTFELMLQINNHMHRIPSPLIKFISLWQCLNFLQRIRMKTNYNWPVYIIIKSVIWWKHNDSPIANRQRKTGLGHSGMPNLHGDNTFHDIELKI